MNHLRHDLMTSGWSMLDCSKWLEPFNRDWQECPGLEFRYWGLLPQVYRDFFGEIDWLLHEALYDEKFNSTGIVAIADWPDPLFYGKDRWHCDGGYLTLLFACRGVGTVVARGFENNFVTPHGYALIMTGTHRSSLKKIPATWHASPNNAWERRLFLSTFCATK